MVKLFAKKLFLAYICGTILLKQSEVVNVLLDSVPRAEKGSSEEDHLPPSIIQ